MTYKDAVLNGLDEFLKGLKKTVDGLTAEELRFQASPTSNHITWLVWHMSRVEDNWLTRVSGTDSVWDTGGWASKTGVTGEAYSGGNSKTMEEVGALPDVSIATLLDYYDAVRARTIGVLDGMTDADMANCTNLGYAPRLATAGRRTANAKAPNAIRNKRPPTNSQNTGYVKSDPLSILMFGRIAATSTRPAPTNTSE